MSNAEMPPNDLDVATVLARRIAPTGAAASGPVLIDSFEVYAVPTCLGLRLDDEVPTADDPHLLAREYPCLRPLRRGDKAKGGLPHRLERATVAGLACLRACASRSFWIACTSWRQCLENAHS